ncbi:NADH-quinone oxidoreductase subunit 5 family protein [Anaerocolumna chitinilytica]|uniref:Oxidoreductase n=1 Tax=Anaerocolumna chitinilytica TaxID=1727145 RepID=A0A7I8DIK1_9FIRM|nr:proton-conducting transporter membrane subunit [Anaerocolumna chitinilytica]BCJ97547.1 oxidoreductase [Anaerocolumna chitinilytica]
MNLITTLILFPLAIAVLTFLIRNEKVRGAIVTLGAVCVALLSVLVTVKYFQNGITFSYKGEEAISYLIMLLEVLIAVYVITISIRDKKYLVTVFSIIQTPLTLWFELTKGHAIEVANDMVYDKLTGIMVLIVGIIGSLICIYAVGYMKDYHHHHTEFKERKSFFLSVLFLFLGAMFGLVISNNMTWLYFCWEITSLCSFLLIGYTRTEEAKNNSYRALTINLGGGVAFAIAIVFVGIHYQTTELSVLTSMQPEAAVMIPVFLLALAALTKSAQFPFSSWLLGAMVAPTPSSALLHSATMVKAGVYLIIRLAPLLGDSPVGIAVTGIGCVTFLLSSLAAVTQSDGKKILAYSTVANLGLIVICASIGSQEALWAAILLIIFHASSKSLMFLCVGSIEHQIGSRNVEDMGTLAEVSRKLNLFMFVGIAGMFLAPFGMLISKWVAMKAFIDSKHILSVVVIAYGSAVTLFYWTKWMGKLVSGSNKKHQKDHKISLHEELPITIHALLVVVSCFAFPFISDYALVPYLTDLFGKNATIPIGTSDINLMMIMLAMLIIIPISFIPLYKKDKRRIVPIYMAGENTGDNETFHGSLGQNRKVELRNWYLTEYFDSKKMLFYGNIIAVLVLVFGLILLIGGFAK